MSSVVIVLVVSLGAGVAFAGCGGSVLPTGSTGMAASQLPSDADHCGGARAVDDAGPASCGAPGGGPR